LLGLQRREEKIPNDLRWQEGGGNILLSTDVPFLSRHHRDTLFGDRKLDSILLGEGWIRFTWTKSELPKIITGVGYYISVGICDDESFIALNIHKTIDDVYDTVALNGQHPFSKWLLSLEGDEGRGVGKEQIAKAMRNALKLTFEATRYHAVRELQDFITKWNQIENLSPNLVCPVTSFNETMFQAPGAAALFPTNYGVPPTASSQRGKADPQPRTAATKPSRTKRGRIKTGGTKSK
jgi:hypothetical protein